jgi:replicative DNA helicase
MIDPIINEKEHLLLSYIFSNLDLFVKTSNIVRQEYFDKPLNYPVEFVMSYYMKYNSVPDFEIIKAETGVTFDYKEVTKDKFNYVCDEVEMYCRHAAMRLAIRDGIDFLETGDYGAIENRVREALTVSIDKDLGLNIFENPAMRLMMMQESIDSRSIGWGGLDEMLDFIKRGEIILFAGGSGSGKSVVLTNVARNLGEAGLDVLYISLELKDALVAKRFDSILTGIDTKEIFDNIEEIENLYEDMAKNCGNIWVKKMSVGTTSNNIRAYLLEYQLQFGKVPDVILVDYLDLMKPNEKMSNGNKFDEDKAITEELREVFGDYDTYGFSASQLNREAIDAAIKSQSHIAGGLSKINTSDAAIAISRTEEQIDNNEIEFQALKLRNSEMSTTPVKMHWNSKNLRISERSSAANINVALNNNTTKKATGNKNALDEILKRGKIKI